MTEPRRFILWTDQQVRNCLEFISGLSLPDGRRMKRPFQVEISKHVQSLTEEQRGGLHLLLSILARETGYRVPELKQVVKERVFGVEEREGPDGRLYRFVRSSEDANKLEYSDLIEECYILGADLGIRLPALDPRLRKRRAAA